jgi:hypothetical protein
MGWIAVNILKRALFIIVEGDGGLYVKKGEYGEEQAGTLTY